MNRLSIVAFLACSATFGIGYLVGEHNLEPTTAALVQKLSDANESMKTCSDALREKNSGYTVISSAAGSWEVRGRADVKPMQRDADGVVIYLHEDGTEERVP